MFQFTRPAWGATLCRGMRVLSQRFNSRAPRGARRVPIRNTECRTSFNSRAPRGARQAASSPSAPSPVSIHAPRVGRDVKFSGSGQAMVFQFTRPAWGATECIVGLPGGGKFQFTRPAWGATHRELPNQRGSTSFNSRAPRGARHLVHPNCPKKTRFNSRAPRGARRNRAPPKQSLTSFNSRAPRGARPQ